MISVKEGVTGADGDFIYLPRTSHELIDWLDQLYPKRTMERGETVEDHLRYAGMRDLVDQLIQYREEEMSLAGSDRAAGTGG